MAKNKSTANSLSIEIASNKTKKVSKLFSALICLSGYHLFQVYLARVKGRFPLNLNKLKVLDTDTLYAAMKESPESADGAETLVCGGGGRSSSSSTIGRKRGREDYLCDENAPNDRDTPRYNRESYDSAILPSVYDHPEVGYAVLDDGSILLRCAIGVVSFRDGVHANDPVMGKSAVTSFKLLAYRETDDTSLVECKPLTGRTHQIRLHVQLLGNPIANDPCYGGKIFYGEESKRETAIRALEEIRLRGKKPLGSVNHIVRLIGLSDATQGDRSPVTTTADISLDDDYFQKRDVESDVEHLARTCRCPAFSE
jgi:hypothetical protein